MAYQNWATSAFLGAASSAALLLAAPAAMAQNSQYIDIPTQSLGDALIALSDTYGVDIAADEGLIRNRSASPVSGTLSLRQAMSQALQGTGLEVQRRDNGGFVIVAQSEDARSRLTPVDEIVVQGNRTYLYREDFTEALGFGMSVSELPATVNIVTSDFIEDTFVYDLEDFATFIPGVTTGGFSGGGREAFIVRGFATEARYLNGMFQFGNQQQPISIENIERVEFAKGPAGADFALADAGGSFNVVTKKPLKDFAAEVSASGGDLGFFRIAGDVTGPVALDGAISGRLIASYSERAEFRPGRPNRTPRYTVAPSLAWDYADGGRIIFEYQRTFSDEPEDRGTIYLEGAGFEETDNFLPALSPHQEFDGRTNEINTNRFDISIEQDIGDIFAVEIRGQRYAETRERVDVNFVNFSGLYEEDGLTWNGITRESNLWSFVDDVGDFNNQSVQALLRANVATGRWIHRARLGYQYTEADNDEIFGGGFGRPVVSNTLDVFNPDNNQILNFTGEREAFGPGVFTAFQASQDISTFFFQYSGTWNERLRVLAGVRHYDRDALTVGFFDVSGVNTPFTFNEGADKQTSFRLSASYDVFDSLALFGGYSDGYTPQNGVIQGGGQIDDLHNVSFELGAKAQLFNGGVLWTNTIYQITQSNISAVDPDDPNFRIPFGEVRIRGFESEFIGSVNEDLDVSAGLTYQDSENTETDNAALQGNEFFNVPNFQASLFASYRFSKVNLPDLTARFGAVHVGERQGNAENNFQLPGYTRVDLGLRYSISEQTSVDLYVENVFDEFYIEQTQGRTVPFSGVIPGDPRLVQFVVRHAF